MEHLLSHRVFVSTRPAGAEAYTTAAAGVIDWESQTLTVPAAPPTPAHGLAVLVATMSRAPGLERSIGPTCSLAGTPEEVGW